MEMSVDEIHREIARNSIHRAVTFSGGDPFAQAEEALELARRLRTDGYEIAAFSGYTIEELLAGTDAQRKLLALLDVLVDGRFIAEERTLELSFRGSSNQRIIDVGRSLASGRAVIDTSERWNP